MAQLVAQRETVATQLQEISAVRSPYSGTVRRVRVLGQSERVMNVEVVVEVEDQARKSNPSGGADWVGGAEGEGRGDQKTDGGASWQETSP